MRERTIQEEFEEADREAAVEEVRMKRDLSIDELLEYYVEHCRDVRRVFAGSFEARSSAIDTGPEVDSEFMRLAELIDGPPSPAR